MVTKFLSPQLFLQAQDRLVWRDWYNYWSQAKSCVYTVIDTLYTGNEIFFFMKGQVTNHEQVPVTLVLNQFIEVDNGIDIAIFSCDIRVLDQAMILGIDSIRWHAPDSFRIGSPVWLVHYPTSSEPDGVPSTHRLSNACHPTVSTGIILSEDFNSLTIDSTIIATGGSSGGLIIDENGLAVAVHDSQHDETPDHTPVSTHRMVRELRMTLRSNKQLCNLFDWFDVVCMLVFMQHMFWF